MSDSDSDFDLRAEERWRRCSRQYRKSLDEPFCGDPVAEGMEECLDLRNYTLEALRQGRISELDSEDVCLKALSAYKVFVDNASDPGVELEPVTQPAKETE